MWITDIFRKMLPVGTFPESFFIGRIDFFQFFPDSGRKLLINETRGQLTQQPRSFYGGRAVLPTVKAEQFLVEFFRKSFCPRQWNQLGVDVRLQDFVKFVAIASRLMSGDLIYQSDDADARESF